MAGWFISFEGPDGAGKSTVIQTLKTKLAPILSTPVLVTREPGGSEIAEEIRKLILDINHPEMDDWTEALLYAASRRQHLVEVIAPSLAKGNVVLCDRYVDSSIAYQGGGRQLGLTKVKTLNDFAIQGKLPDLTLYLDVPVQVGLTRIQKNGQDLDRLEAQKLDFHERVRQAYLKLGQQNPQRIVKIDATASLTDVVAQCLTVILQHLPDHLKGGTTK